MGGRISKCLNVLRIATTVLFSTLAIFFLVLWIRSYMLAESGMISTIPNQHVAFSGGQGRMCVWFEHSAAPSWFDWDSRQYLEEELEPIDPELRIPVFDLAFFWPTMTRLYVAHWLLVISTSLIAVAPCCPRKFTIRSTLIAVTVISVITAIICWVDSNLQ